MTRASSSCACAWSSDAFDTSRAAVETASAVSAACHAAGLLTLTCGTYGNVLRFLPPLVISDDELARGLDILDAAFG